MLHAAPSAGLELIKEDQIPPRLVRTSRAPRRRWERVRGGRVQGRGLRVKGRSGTSAARFGGGGREGPALSAALQVADGGGRYLGREGEDHRQQRERRQQQHQQPPRAPHLLGHCRQRCHLRDRPAERAGPGLPAPGPPRRLKARGRVRGGDCARGPALSLLLPEAKGGAYAPGIGGRGWRRPGELGSVRHKNEERTPVLGFNPRPPAEAFLAALDLPRGRMGNDNGSIVRITWV